MANSQSIADQNLEYRGVQRGSVTGVNLIISVFEDNIVCVEKRVAATDREGREGLGGWWVLSYNCPLNTFQVIPSCSRLFCTAKYYHIIGPSILYLPTFLYCRVLSYNWRSSSVPPARLLLARRRNCEVILDLCFSDYGGGSTVSYSERAAWILLLRFHSIPLLHAGLPFGDRYLGVCVFKYAG